MLVQYTPKRITKLFQLILQQKCVFDIDLAQFELKEVEETFDLCNCIIEVVDEAIISQKDFSDLYQAILDKCKMIEGFRGCNLYKNIAQYFYFKKVEKDNDFYKSEYEGFIQNNFVWIRHFVRLIKESKDVTIQM